jgi:hypothetical protein
MGSRVHLPDEDSSHVNRPAGPPHAAVAVPVFRTPNCAIAGRVNQQLKTPILNKADIARRATVEFVTLCNGRQLTQVVVIVSRGPIVDRP